MTVLDHQSDGSFGFAPARPSSQPQHQATTAKVIPVRPAQPAVRADLAANRPLKYRAPRFRAAQIAGRQFAVGAPAERHRSSAPLTRSKIWFALGLASLIYAIGGAGIWSIYQTFDAPSSITPVEQTVPALPAGKPDDFRDAHLQEEADGHHFRPAFRTPI